MKKLSLLLALSAVAGAAHAVVLSSTGFESPFVAGDVDGQNGWEAGISEHGTGSATITTARSSAGAQSLLITSTAPADDSSSFYAFPSASLDYTGGTAAANQKLLVSSAQVYVTSTTATTNVELAGLLAFTANAAVAGAFIGAGDGQLYVYASSRTAAITGYYSVRNAFGNLNTFNALSFTLDYSSSALAPAITVGLNGTTYSLTGLSGAGLTAADSTITDVDMVVISTANNTISANFDNYSVQAVQAVPEPAAFAPLALGVVALVRRRKRA